MTFSEQLDRLEKLFKERPDGTHFYSSKESFDYGWRLNSKLILDLLRRYRKAEEALESVMTETPSIYMSRCINALAEMRKE
jgi:hypothetical protein